MHGRAITPSPTHARRPALLAVGGSSDGGGAELMQVSAGTGRNVTPNFPPFCAPSPRKPALAFSAHAMTGHTADLETVAALIRGEHAAFTSLVRAHQPA